MGNTVFPLSDGYISASVSLDIDELVPAASLWTTDRYAGVKLRMKGSGPGSETPVTVATLFKSTVDRIPNNTAMGESAGSFLPKP